MGMFDDIRVHVPLPIGDAKTEFQTKSLDCYLEHYELREDGSLWKRPMGENWSLSTEWELCNLTGEVSFYSHVPAAVDEHNATGWVEYSAYFVNGKMQILNRLLNRWLSQPVWDAR